MVSILMPKIEQIEDIRGRGGGAALFFVKLMLFNASVCKTELQ